MEAIFFTFIVELFVWKKSQEGRNVFHRQFKDLPTNENGQVME